MLAGNAIVNGRAGPVLRTDDAPGASKRRDGMERDEEGLEQQRVERGHGDDRAASSRFVEGPAHGTI